MNGWKRLGVVISGAWILLVVSYAAYEFYTFPLKPFVSYTGSTAAGYEGDRQGFWFVRAVTKSGPESLTATERTFFEKQIKEAKTDEERQIHVAAYNVPETSSGLKPLFFMPSSTRATDWPCSTADSIVRKYGCWCACGARASL